MAGRSHFYERTELSHLFEQTTAVWAYSDVRDKIAHNFRLKSTEKCPVWAYRNIHKKIAHYFGKNHGQKFHGSPYMPKWAEKRAFSRQNHGQKFHESPYMPKRPDKPAFSSLNMVHFFMNVHIRPACGGRPRICAGSRFGAGRLFGYGFEAASCFAFCFASLISAFFAAAAASAAAFVSYGVDSFDIYISSSTIT